MKKYDDAKKLIKIISEYHTKEIRKLMTLNSNLRGCM